MLPPAVANTMPVIISQYWRGYSLYSDLSLVMRCILNQINLPHQRKQLPNKAWKEGCNQTSRL